MVRRRVEGADEERDRKRVKESLKDIVKDRDRGGKKQTGRNSW